MYSNLNKGEGGHNLSTHILSTVNLKIATTSQQLNGLIFSLHHSSGDLFRFHSCFYVGSIEILG